MKDDKEALREALKHLKAAEAAIEQRLDGEETEDYRLGGGGWVVIIIFLLTLSALADKYEDAAGWVIEGFFSVLILAFLAGGCYELYQWLKTHRIAAAAPDS